MRKLVLFMHISLDGFVAGPNGKMDWIRVSDDIFDYAGERTDQADTGLYGRVTYEMMQSYWPTAGDSPDASKHDIEHSQWYNNVNKVVISQTMRGQQLPQTRIISDDVPAQVAELKQREGREIVMFGSPSVAHTLTDHDLIDDYWLFVNPVILGHGIPLFKDVDKRIELRLAECKVFSSGVVCLHYERSTK